MSQLKLGGQVFGVNAKPITNAEVVIIDNDFGGNGNDIIFKGSTNHEGKFHALSRNWKDDNWIRGPLGNTINTVDHLDLDFIVKKSGEEHSGKFFIVGDYLSIPIICPWNNPDVIFSKVNNIFCYTAEETVLEMEKCIMSKSPMTLHIFDPVIKTIFEPLTFHPNIQQQHIASITGVTEASGILLILLGVAAIMVAGSILVGASLIGSAVLLAITEGCTDIVFTKDTEIDNDGSSKDTTKATFEC